MRSCERPRKRSASEALPSSVSKRYSLSIRTHGSSCRSRATSSLRRVSSFSALRSLTRCASHSFCDTILCSCFRFFDLVAFALIIAFLAFLAFRYWPIPRLRDQPLSISFTFTDTTNEQSYFGHSSLAAPQRSSALAALSRWRSGKAGSAFVIRHFLSPCSRIRDPPQKQNTAGANVVNQKDKRMVRAEHGDGLDSHGREGHYASRRGGRFRAFLVHIHKRLVDHGREIKVPRPIHAGKIGPGRKRVLHAQIGECRTE